MKLWLVPLNYKNFQYRTSVAMPLCLNNTQSSWLCLNYSPSEIGPTMYCTVIMANSWVVLNELTIITTSLMAYNSNTINFKWIVFCLATMQCHTNFVLTFIHKNCETKKLQYPGGGTYSRAVKKYTVGGKTFVVKHFLACKMLKIGWCQPKTLVNLGSAAKYLVKSGGSDQNWKSCEGYAL